MVTNSMINQINKYSKELSSDKNNRDEENNYSISLDYIRDNNLKISKIAYKNFFEIRGTGKLDYVVKIGLDFGNSSTKIVYSRVTKRNANKSKSEALVLSCNELNIFTKDNIPQTTISKLSINKKVRIENFKLNLLEKIMNHKSDNIFKEKEYYYCIYYIACILQYSKSYIIQEKTLKRIKDIDWKIDMGIPSDGKKDKDDINSVFQRILFSAITLSSNNKILSHYGINFNEWKALCDEVDIIDTNLKGVCYHVFPELYAEALNLYESDNNPGDQAILVDVGSVTLDITFIVKNKNWANNNTNIALLNSRVLPLGMEKLIEINNSINIEKGCYNINSFKAICNNPSIPDLCKYIKREFGSIIESFYKYSSNYFNLKKDRDYKFYWFGGARDAVFIKQLFLDPFQCNSYLYNIRPLYQPNQISSKEGNDYRYSVAYGLLLTDFYNYHHSVSTFTNDICTNTVNYHDNMETKQQNIYGN